MMKNIKKAFESAELKETILPDAYALSRERFRYIRFKISPEEYYRLSAVRLTMEVTSGRSAVVLNQYLGTEPEEVEGLNAAVTYPASVCEAGENAFAYKGQVRIKEIELLYEEEAEAAAADDKLQETAWIADKTDPLLDAAQFLFNIQIKGPERSPFKGACWTLYDYDDECPRLVNWLWDNAVVVACMAELIKSGRYPEKKALFLQFAREVGEEFLRTQILEEGSEVYGALTARWEYPGHPAHSYDCYLGPNDASFAVKWALLPLYELTGEPRYLEASRLALDWVKKTIYLPDRDYLPLDYDFTDGTWGKYSIIDTAFIPEGFTEYDRLNRTHEFTEDSRFFMDRFIRQYRLDNGFYGQNYDPDAGVDQVIFTRGLGWTIEGLLAAYRGTEEKRYLKEAAELARLTAKEQNEDGSFSYILGYHGVPEQKDREGTGICEKATAILAYLFYDICTLDQSQKELLESADRAMVWCEANIHRGQGMGYGGIKAAGIKSGITCMSYLTIATQYANAFYILAKLKRMEAPWLKTGSYK